MAASRRRLAALCLRRRTCRVPVTDKPRTYESPPWRAEPWIEDRPAQLGMQPSGPRLGNQGPDQGFVLTLLEHVEHELVLAPGEHAEDALTGCAAGPEAGRCSAGLPSSTTSASP
ncbi:MAG: hypothetical protein R2690_05355 [Acidimicrobiales bacterium]